MKNELSNLSAISEIKLNTEIIQKDIFKIKNLKIFSKDYIWRTWMTKLRKKVAKK